MPAPSREFKDDEAERHGPCGNLHTRERKSPHASRGCALAKRYRPPDFRRLKFPRAEHGLHFTRSRNETSSRVRERGAHRATPRGGRGRSEGCRAPLKRVTASRTHSLEKVV